MNMVAHFSLFQSPTIACPLLPAQHYVPSLIPKQAPWEEEEMEVSASTEVLVVIYLCLVEKDELVAGDTLLLWTPDVVEENKVIALV